MTHTDTVTYDVYDTTYMIVHRCIHPQVRTLAGADALSLAA